jgi:CHAT domain-containing protein
VVILPASEAQPHRDRLSLVLVAPDRPPIAKLIELDDRQLHRTIRLFLNRLNTYHNNDYLADAQQLYQWLVQPIASELEQLGADTLIFSLDAGLRRIPLAALHDGQQFLVEKYSLGYIPSLSLTDTHYQPLHNAQVLAMGASEFPSGQEPLPAVPLELSTIVGHSQPIALDAGEGQNGQKSERHEADMAQIGGLWRGRSFLNQAFTLENLIRQRHEHPYSIIHLATHASFSPQQREEAYIQFWDRRLSLEGLRQAKWYDASVVELLVLSACETAVGDELTEMGFAGLAVRSGVKSALASLWKVSDTGTLAIIGQFYRSLKEVPIKSEALRQAQISMIRGQVQMSGSHVVSPNGQVSLALEHNGTGSNENFSHPYYWAGFTLIGSPW